MVQNQRVFDGWMGGLLLQKCYRTWVTRSRSLISVPSRGYLRLKLFFLPEPREIGGQTFSLKVLDNLQPFFPAVELAGYRSIPGFTRG